MNVIILLFFLSPFFSIQKWIDRSECVFYVNLLLIVITKFSIHFAWDEILGKQKWQELLTYLKMAMYGWMMNIIIADAIAHSPAASIKNAPEIYKWNNKRLEWNLYDEIVHSELHSLFI